MRSSTSCSEAIQPDYYADAMAPSPDSAAGPRKSPLSRQTVVAAALGIIDDEGYNALTMRGLAQRLGVYPATVYWHAGNKSQLLALVSDHVLRQIEVPVFDGSDWKGWFLELGHRSRAVFARHPRFAAYFGTNIQVSSASLSMADSVIHVLLRSGFEGEDLVHSYNAAFGGIFAWLTGEFAAEPEHEAIDFDAALAALPPDEIPALRSQFELMSNRAWMVRWNSGSSAPMAASFTLMMTSVLEGIDSRRRTR
jgi:TetR/AcrR family tetracycline transcriptional repressor